MLKAVRTVPEEQIDDYEAASQSYRDAHERLTEIEAEISRLEDPRRTAVDDNDLDAAAKAYLAGTQDPASFKPLLERLRIERELVERAVGIGRERLNAARDARNNEIVKSLRPAHRQAAARVAECLVELAEANAEEARIRQQAPGGALPFLSFPGVDLGQPDTQAKRFLCYLKRTYGIEPAPRTARLRSNP